MKADIIAADLDRPAEELAERSAGMASTEQCVPLESLAMPEEGEQMANPEVGDVVSYTVEGKVTRIEGGKAYVEPTAINGKPMSEKEEPAGDGMADLERAAGETGYLG